MSPDKVLQYWLQTKTNKDTAHSNYKQKIDSTKRRGGVLFETEDDYHSQCFLIGSIENTEQKSLMFVLLYSTWGLGDWIVQYVTNLRYLSRQQVRNNF